jgi:NAD(P)-dependent dehydrogenase (short-subunit alcohol dehydrogenase family)
MARLHNAVTVVTGAGGGVGRQAALRLSAEGSRVGLTDLDVSSLEETAAMVREPGVRRSRWPGTSSPSRPSTR